MKLRRFGIVAAMAGWMVFSVSALAQNAAPTPPAEAPPAEAPPAGTVEGDAAATTNQGSGGFLAVIMGSGWLGILLWLALFGTAGAAAYFAIDSAIVVRVKRIMPQALIDNVTAAMGEGDVLKALHHCENDPGPLANILTAGFSHVEEGFDVIQEAIATSAELETEKMIQKLTWLSVMSNVAPMLGLLGTVQGMIMAFKSLGTGAPDIGYLAMSIAQALYTTAGGLAIAIPSVTVFYAMRNNANKIILRMQALTMELIKDLRNVEVVQE